MISEHGNDIWAAATQTIGETPDGLKNRARENGFRAIIVNLFCTEMFFRFLSPNSQDRNKQ